MSKLNMYYFFQLHPGFILWIECKNSMQDMYVALIITVKLNCPDINKC